LFLTPEPYVEEEQTDNDIPLTIDVARPMPILNIEKSDDDKKAQSLVDQFGTYDHKLELASYKYPTLDLLENYGSNKIPVNTDELEANKNKIVETLNHYNIEIDKIKATIGPTVYPVRNYPRAGRADLQDQKPGGRYRAEPCGPRHPYYCADAGQGYHWYRGAKPAPRNGIDALYPGYRKMAEYRYGPAHRTW
jgi:hypothetical protein